ncbi:MAG TPA: YbhB/YbcL family Raf kinase inhibitor-like protein [Polyangiaceae bacterium]|nr:YbhB/YbcL family Raf kinase inhibitor-like protein [Polyangiaceae bacterium]
MTKNLCLALVAFGCSGGHGCKSGGGQPSPVPGVALGSLAVTSRSFPPSRAIPVDYTCDGADKSPQLTWSAPPAGTQTFAILAEDPDAPGGTFTHWIAYNVRGDARELPETADPSTLGGTVGNNDFNRPGYAGPCPPKGELHRYYFHVLALNAAIDVKPGATREAVDGALSGHVLAQGVLVGTFSH